MAKPEPGRDPEMVERTQKLNLTFALSSLGLLLILSLMVWADYDREWKKYQLEFNRMEVQRTEEQIQQAQGKVDAKRMQELQARLAQGEQEAAGRSQEIEKVRAELSDLQAEWYRTDQDFRFTKAEIDVARFEYEDSGHKGKGNVEKKKAKLDELENSWNELRLKLEDVIARQRAAEARLGELEKTKLEAEKSQKELLTERSPASSPSSATCPSWTWPTRR
jgi:capsule polysaccharide export protein KpsE/RkpR